MFSRILFATVTAASLASARPALAAEDAAATHHELHASASPAELREAHRCSDPAVMAAHHGARGAAPFDERGARHGEQAERSLFAPEFELNQFGGA